MTQRFIVVRHGHSPAPAQMADFDRPLSETGGTQIVRTAAAIRDAGNAPTHVLASPARRAWASAEILARELGIESTRVAARESIYEASVATLVVICREELDHHDFPVIVGHNPGISALIQVLAPEKGRRWMTGLGTAGWACLETTGDLSPGSVDLVDVGT